MALSIVFLLISMENIAQSSRSYSNTVPVEGTPYMEDAYVKGAVYLKDQTYDTDLRYNILADQMEFKRSGNVESLVPDMAVRKVVIGKNTFVADQYLQKGQLTYGFFMLLDSGKIGFMKKLNVVITPYVAAAPFQDAKPAAYARKADTYYIKIGTQTLLEIRNIKKLIQSLPDHQKEMDEFAKKEKISADDPEELVKFSRYYHSLQ